MKARFKFDLRDKVLYRNNHYVIVGRAEYISEGQSKYLLQEAKYYLKVGVDYFTCTWADEKELVKDEKTTNT